MRGGIESKRAPRAQPSGYFEFDPDRGQVKFDIPLEKKSYLVNNTRTK